MGKITRERALKSDVVFFTYTIGTGADKSIAKRLACENKGVFYPVPDGADLDTIMGMYFQYFSTGQEVCSNNYVSYTAVGTGSKLYGACMPMYNRTGKEKSLLGVSCLDVNLLGNMETMRSQAGWNHFKCQASDISKQCRSLDLHECHRQRVRRDFSEESVCEFSAEQRMWQTDETTCPCQDPNCQDDPDFVDELMYFCDTWIGDNCVDVDPQWGYSEKGLKEVQEKCKRSCGLCKWRDPCPYSNPLECPPIPVPNLPWEDVWRRRGWRCNELPTRCSSQSFQGVEGRGRQEKDGRGRGKEASRFRGFCP